MTYKFIAIKFLCLMVLLAGTGSLVSAAGRNASLLVEPEQLRQMLGSQDLVILDVRSAASYQEGHIAGAVNLPVSDTFQQTGRTDRVAGPAHIQGLLGQAGIDRQKRVIIYDDGKFIDAGRMFWVLEVYGHNNAALLNYGFGGWLERGLPVSMDAYVPQPLAFLAVSQPNRLVTKLSMRLATSSDAFTILDARSAEEFNGKESISSRYGHIPRAVNIPWSENIAQDSDIPRVKTLDELTEVYRDLDPNKKVITYCNKGKQSSFSYFVLRYMGYDVAHYDGSWFEWSTDENLPIVSP